MFIKHALAAVALVSSLAFAAPAASKDQLFRDGVEGQINAQFELPPWNTQPVGPKHGMTWACKNYDDLLKFDHLAIEDFEASWKLARQRCVYLPNGTEITVEDTNLLHSVLCVRPKGYPDCLWIKSIYTAR